MGRVVLFNHRKENEKENFNKDDIYGNDQKTFSPSMRRQSLYRH